MLLISSLYVYPIKSLGGISLQNARVTDRGLEHDRRWMLIDANNRFLSQREVKQMALFKPELITEGLKVTYTPTQASITIPYQPQTNIFIDVTVWDDTCRGQLVNEEANSWFSDLLGMDCRLVYMPDNTHRAVDPKYAHINDITSFSDAYPFLLISQATIDDVSRRVGEIIPMNRFRPNIVFTGSEAFAEDELAHFSVNGIHFYGVKLCARCPIPGIDQNTAQFVKEPLKTLAGYRRMNNKIYVGQNLIHRGEGVIGVGDEMEVLEMKAAAVFDHV